MLSSSSSSTSSPPLRNAPNLRALAVSSLSGIAFGFALHKAGVHRADVITAQLQLQSSTMLVVFLVAAATSVLMVTWLHATEAFGDVVFAAGKGLRHSSGLAAPAAGGSLLGLGMAIGGACPGTVWAQIGAGSAGSLVTLAGGVAGATLYSLIPKSSLSVLEDAGRVPHAVLHDVWRVGRTTAGSTVAAALLLVVAAVVVTEWGVAPVTGVAWHPAVAGVAIGVLQVPLVAGVQKTMGCSSSFSVLSKLFTSPADALRTYTAGAAGWQLVYVASAAVGSALALAASPDDTPYDVSVHVPFARRLVGGALITLGARLGNGCTSGHGISGMGHLALRSFVAVACMFGVGIATSCLLL